MPTPSSAAVRLLVWGAMIVLALLHQDFWLWNNRDLLLGFLPAGLAYHILFSLVAAVLWATAVRWTWPTQWEKWADNDPDENPPPAGKASP